MNTSLKNGGPVESSVITVEDLALMTARRFDEFEADIFSELHDVKNELKEDIAAVRFEMSELRTELKGDIQAVRSDMINFKNELKEGIYSLGVLISGK